MITKGIYIKHKNGNKIKIANGLKFDKYRELADVLDEFVKYLKEKPDSRTVSYLSEEKHSVICCYRCGYLYNGGDICPNCGSEQNK